MVAFCFARSRLVEIGGVLVRFDDVARGIDTFSKSQTHGYRSFQSGYRMAKNGAPERIRTPNLLIRSQMLYPVELRAQKSDFTYENTVQIQQ